MNTKRPTGCTILINGNPNVSFDLHEYVQRILKKQAVHAGQFEFTFVDKDTIVRLNKTHLNRSYVTDIITFNLEEPGDPIIADVYICTDQAQENARHFQHPYEDEIRLLIIHGILHLLGYEDYTPEDKKEMDQTQFDLLEWSKK